MIVHLDGHTAIASVCERLGEHMWCCIGDQTRCAVCGAVLVDGQGFAAAHHQYDLYLRGLVEDQEAPHE